MPDLLPLHLVAAGLFARIEQILGAAEQVQRLEELGLRAGTRVEVVQHGSPCIVRLTGSTLCLRDGAALQVLVRVDAAA